jgi:hypothetical protein
MSDNYTILKSNNKLLNMSFDINSKEQINLLRDLRNANNFAENDLQEKATLALENMGYDAQQARILGKKFAKKYSQRKELHRT